jgi:hypothetical protein
MYVYLRKVRINKSGYDSNGRYWGLGSNLYHYYAEQSNEEGHVRASDRNEAKEKIRALYPDTKLRFFN